VLAATEQIQHLGRVADLGGLPEDAPGADHDRVDAEHGTVAAVHRPCLAGRVLERVVARLLEARRDDLERNSE
jgi:hypothetical protein